MSLAHQHMHDLVDVIDTCVAARSLLLHPFYQAWTRGELTLESLRDYARQYYHHVAAFPTYLSALHSRTSDLEVRRVILGNLVDEENGSPNHPELWLDFAEAVGVSSEEVRRTEPWAETRILVRTFDSTCRLESVEEGLATLYAYESQIPAVAGAKIDGLKAFYGIRDPRGLAYFQVHVEADREHAAAERALLEVYLDEENLPAVTRAVDAVLTALWGMLSAICRRHNS